MKSWIIRNVVSRKPEMLIPFYRVFLRPKYAVQVWVPTARHWGIIMKIEDCQRHFTRIIEGMGLSTSLSPKGQYLRLTTSLEHQMYGDFETFKIINSNCFVDYDYNVFGTNTAYRTCNVNVTSHHLLTSAHGTFSNRVIKYCWHYAWKTSINAFKADLDFFYNLSK